MSSYAEVVVISEGLTELRFVKQVLGPYLAEQGLYLIPVMLDKPGQKGGDVKFARARNDIGKHLKQRRDTWVTLFVDYYAIRGDWPGYIESKRQKNHARKAQIMKDATTNEVKNLYPGQYPAKRFIPYVSMHEIEALYFSDPVCLAEKMGVPQPLIAAILAECGEPEKINDQHVSAPSRRLEKLSNRFKKTSTGIAIATAIGIPRMRSACPLFNAWLLELESITKKKEDGV